MLVKYHIQNLFYVLGGIKRSFVYFPFKFYYYVIMNFVNIYYIFN